MTTQHYETITQPRAVRHKRKSILDRILIPKDERPKTTELDKLIFVGIATTIVSVASLAGFEYVKGAYVESQLDLRADKCRIKHMVLNLDDTKSYMCNSVYNDDIVYMIHEFESRQIRQNPYINRPVYVLKDGTFR